MKTGQTFSSLLSCPSNICRPKGRVCVFSAKVAFNSLKHNLHNHYYENTHITGAICSKERGKLIITYFPAVCVTSQISDFGGEWHRRLNPGSFFHWTTSPVLFVFHFETGSPKFAWGLANLWKQNSNLQSSCLGLLSLWFTGMSYCTQPKWGILSWLKISKAGQFIPGNNFILCKYSASVVLSEFHDRSGKRAQRQRNSKPCDKGAIVYHILRFISLSQVFSHCGGPCDSGSLLEMPLMCGWGCRFISRLWWCWRTLIISTFGLSKVECPELLIHQMALLWKSLKYIIICV